MKKYIIGLLTAALPLYCMENKFDEERMNLYKKIKSYEKEIHKNNSSTFIPPSYKDNPLLHDKIVQEHNEKIDKLKKELNECQQTLKDLILKSQPEMKELALNHMNTKGNISVRYPKVIEESKNESGKIQKTFVPTAMKLENVTVTEVINMLSEKGITLNHKQVGMHNKNKGDFYYKFKPVDGEYHLFDSVKNETISSKKHYVSVFLTILTK